MRVILCSFVVVARVGVDGVGDLPQVVWIVVDGVYRCYYCEQYLCGADVGGCLVAVDVLFARLQ